jgi:hypothetical protein
MGSDFCTARIAASSKTESPLGRTIQAFSTWPSGAELIAITFETFGAKLTTTPRSNNNASMSQARLEAKKPAHRATDNCGRKAVTVIE